MNIKALVFLLLISLTLAAPSFAERGLINLTLSAPSLAERGLIPWSEVPLFVQQIITRHAGSEEIDKVKKEKIILLNKRGDEEKTDLFLAKIISLHGKKTWIVVDKDGELIDIADEELEEVPEDIVGVKRNKHSN